MCRLDQRWTPTAKIESRSKISFFFRRPRARPFFIISSLCFRFFFFEQLNAVIYCMCWKSIDWPFQSSRGNLMLSKNIRKSTHMAQKFLIITLLCLNIQTFHSFVIRHKCRYYYIFLISNCARKLDLLMLFFFCVTIYIFFSY